MTTFLEDTPPQEEFAWYFAAFPLFSFLFAFSFFHHALSREIVEPNAAMFIRSKRDSLMRMAL